MDYETLIEAADEWMAAGPVEDPADADQALADADDLIERLANALRECIYAAPVGTDLTDSDDLPPFPE